MSIEDSTKSECAIIGISMLNAHFTAHNIQRTLETVKTSFSKVVFMLPDKPAEHTLEGYGYDQKDAQKTVRRKFKTLERDCRESIAGLQLPDVDIVRWEQVEQKEAYEMMLKAINELYENDPSFKACIRVTTQAVYEGSKFPTKKDMTIERQIDAGIHFLFKELAFILSSPALLGASETTYLYHKEMPVLSKLLDGTYEFTAPNNVEFQRVKIHEKL